MSAGAPQEVVHPSRCLIRFGAFPSGGRGSNFEDASREETEILREAKKRVLPIIKRAMELAANKRLQKGCSESSDEIDLLISKTLEPMRATCTWQSKQVEEENCPGLQCAQSASPSASHVPRAAPPTPNPD